MKKLIVILLFFYLYNAAAQKIKYSPSTTCPYKLEKIIEANLPEGFNHPKLSYDGSKLLVTKNYRGIYEVDISNPKKIRSISDGEMDGFNMKWTGKNDDITFTHSSKNNDGSFRKEYHKKNLMLKSSSVYDITSISQPIQSLKSLTDDLIILYDFQNRKLVANNGETVWDIVTNVDFCVDVVLSPDKNKVAFDLFGRNYVYAVNGTGKISEFDGGLNKSWSPDGMYILYFKGEDKGTDAIVDSDLYISKADGTATWKLTDTPKILEVWPSWSADGTKITYVDDATGKIYIANVQPQNEKK